jgi:hypothetical protein
VTNGIARLTIHRSGAVQADRYFAFTPYRADNLRACVPHEWAIQEAEIIGDLKSFELITIGPLVTLRDCEDF